MHDTISVNNQPTHDWQESVVFLWITEGYRRTGDHIEINGRKAERLDNGPGDFGMVAHHEGVEDNLSWQFSGPDLVSHGPGVYGLKVPHRGVKKIRVRLAAGRDEKPGDQSDLPHVPSSDDDLPDGCRALLASLFKRFFR